ncbi:MAG: PAS domain-containing protein [Cyanobacteria bacterium P01_A01_bin.137]
MQPSQRDQKLHQPAKVMPPDTTNLNESLYLEQILDNVLAGYWNWDIPNNIKYLSPGFKRMFGYEDHELPNTLETWQNLIFPEDLATVLSNFELHVRSRGRIPYYNEIRYHHKDGSTVWVICSGQVVEWDPDDNPLRMIGCHIDISDRKRVEAQLKQHAASLEAANKELEAFAYAVSHDLRAPLRAIDGFSKALLEDYDDIIDQEGKRFFARIRANVHSMGTLINTLLALSRLSRVKMRYTHVNLSQLVQELIDELQATDQKRHIDAIIAPGVVAWADPTLMRIALTNLLQNAWKFTRQCPIAQIEFGLEGSGQNTTYFIRDNGAGFDMAYHHMLFTVFQRLHTNREFPGLGIGLATVQRIITRHGGTIWAQGAVNQGATFYFTVLEADL